MAKTRSGRIAIVGRPNVGKSTLLNALLGEALAITSRHPQTTRDSIAGIVTRKKTQFVFVDTPGMHQAKNKLGVHMNAHAQGEADQADVIAFMTDVRREPGLSADDQLLLQRIAQNAKAPIVLLLNKIDKLEAKSELFPMLAALGEAHAFAAIVPLSAKKKDNVEAFLKAVEPFIPEGPFAFDAEELSDKPTRFFVAEYVREQILRKVRDEVPHGVAVVVERFEEERKVAQIELVIHVDKESHKGIVIGKGGAMLKRIGEDARARVERLLGRQVNLKTTVRVTPKWYEREGLMSDLGYGKTR